MRPSVCLVILLVFCGCYTVYFHNVLSSPGWSESSRDLGPVQLNTRRTATASVTSTPSPTPTPSPSSSPTPKPSATTSRKVPSHSWEEIEWDALPVIENYKEYEPIPEVVDPCAQGLPQCHRIAQYVLMHYPHYYVKSPNFALEEHRDLWHRGYEGTWPELVRDTRNCVERGVDLCIENPDLADPLQGIVFDGPIETEGLNLSIYNGTIPASEPENTCGNMHRDWEKLIQPVDESEIVDEALFVRVPMSYIFQHTLDGSLPKMVQWLEYMGADTTIILEIVGRRYLCDLPEPQGLPSFCDLRSSVRVARLLHYGCFAPTLHPYSWRRMQNFVGVRELPVDERSVILYTSRSIGYGAHNRKVINEGEVLELIRVHFEKRGVGEEVVVFDASKYNGMSNLRLWNSAKAVIGPHGGAMYNSFFCLPDTVVVEFVDLSSPRRIVVNHLVPHKASSFLGHRYWAIPEVTMGNFHVDLAALQTILDTEFPLPSE